MAKRTIKYRDGEVLLKGLSVEDADLVHKLLVSSEPQLHAWEEPFDKEKCTEFAYGLTKKGDEFQLVEIKYNTEHHWSYVSRVINVSNAFYVARGELGSHMGKNVIDKYFKV